MEPGVGPVDTSIGSRERSMDAAAMRIAPPNALCHSLCRLGVAINAHTGTSRVLRRSGDAAATGARRRQHRTRSTCAYPKKKVPARQPDSLEFAIRTRLFF